MCSQRNASLNSFNCGIDATIGSGIFVRLIKKMISLAIVILTLAFFIGIIALVLSSLNTQDVNYLKSITQNQSRKTSITLFDDTIQTEFIKFGSRGTLAVNGQNALQFASDNTVITLGSTDGLVKSDGTVPMTGNFNMANHEIINVGAIRNTTDNTLVIGNDLIQNINPGSIVCNLGDVSNSYQDIYLSGNLKGTQGSVYTSTLNETGPLAPAGQRDLWTLSNGMGGTGGGYLVYNETKDILYASDSFAETDGGFYSIDGGVNFSPVIFDQDPSAYVIFGFSATTTVAISGNNETYTSTDGINFVRGIDFEGNLWGANIVFFKNLFIIGVNKDATQWVSTSPDGLTWTPRTTPNMGPSPGNGLQFATNGDVVVMVSDVASGVFAAVSNDGIQWNAVTGLTTSCTAITFSMEHSLFIALAGTGEAFTSLNGEQWTSVGDVSPPDVFSIIWVKEFSMYYLTHVDNDGNYSLWTTPNISANFVSTHLDGSVGGVTDLETFSMVVYLPTYNRFIIGLRGTLSVAYSTARPRDLKILSDSIRTRGRPVAVDLYAIYADITCNHTTTATNVSSSVSSQGNLVLQAGQPLGMTLEFNVGFIAATTNGAGDTLTLDFRINNVTKFTHSAIAVPLASNVTGIIQSIITIRSATIQINSTLNQSGALPTIVTATPSYNRTIANTFTIFATWGTNSSTLTIHTLNASAKFINGF